MVLLFEANFNIIPYYQPTFLSSPNVYGHSLICHDNHLYLFGGYQEINRNPHLLKFSLKTKTWSTIHCINTPVDREGHTCVATHNYMYLFAGYGIKQYADVHRFCFRTEKWERIKTKGISPCKRSYHSAVIVGDSMYVFGGERVVRKIPFYMDDTWELNLKEHKWYNVGKGSLEKPPKRCLHGACTVGHYMYIFGGFTTNSVCLNDMYRFDFIQKQWTQVIQGGEIPDPRSSHKMISFKNWLILIGGEKQSNGSHVNEIFEFCVKKNKWRKVTSMIGPNRRGDHAVCLDETSGKVYLHGGYDGNQALSDLYELDLGTLPYRNLELSFNHFIDVQFVD